MSGRRIDDHQAWMGGPGEHSVLPDGPHKVKSYKSSEGEGHLGSSYPDTSEDIQKDQHAGGGKISGHKIKPGYRY